MITFEPGLIIDMHEAVYSSYDSICFRPDGSRIGNAIHVRDNLLVKLGVCESCGSAYLDLIGESDNGSQLVLFNMHVPDDEWADGSDLRKLMTIGALKGLEIVIEREMVHKNREN